jgi:hypothetical protein
MQFPLAGQAMCVGEGDGLAPSDPARGSWCYDVQGTQGLVDYVQQAAAVGFDMVMVSVNMNNTWRSQVCVCVCVLWWRCLPAVRVGVAALCVLVVWVSVETMPCELRRGPHR